MLIQYANCTCIAAIHCSGPLRYPLRLLEALIVSIITRYPKRPPSFHRLAVSLCHLALSSNPILRAFSSLAKTQRTLHLVCTCVFALGLYPSTAVRCHFSSLVTIFVSHILTYFSPLSRHCAQRSHTRCFFKSRNTPTPTSFLRKFLPSLQNESSRARDYRTRQPPCNPAVRIKCLGRPWSSPHSSALPTRPPTSHRPTLQVFHSESCHCSRTC